MRMLHHISLPVADLERSSSLYDATDNGKPGLRIHYGPTYYAAFILDLDGHRIEAVIK